jgi:hypothetical protein
LALFPADREVPECADGYGVQVRLDAMELHRPRQWPLLRWPHDHHRDLLAGATAQGFEKRSASPDVASAEDPD